MKCRKIKTKRNEKEEKQINISTKTAINNEKQTPETEKEMKRQRNLKQTERGSIYKKRQRDRDADKQEKKQQEKQRQKIKKKIKTKNVVYRC